MNFLQLSLGGVLEHYMVDVPHDGTRWDASPAPQVKLFNRDGGVLRASTGATLGNQYTVNAACAADGRTIYIASTGSLRRWEQMWIRSNVTYHWETVTVDKWTTSSVTTLDPLQYAYSTSDVLESHRLYTTVTSGDVGNPELNCYAEWAYTVDTVARKEHTSFHISRYAPRRTLTAAKAISQEPRAREQLGSDQRVEHILQRIWEEVILPDVAKLLGSAGAMVAPEVIEEAHLYKFMEQSYRRAREFDAAKEYAEMYKSQLDEVRLSIVDLDEDGGQGDGDIPRGMRTPRLMRG
jgi:hypothetical protein